MSQCAPIESETLLDGEYKASDILKLVGLTYRQLHDWEERMGVMDSERATAEGWRKFSGEEVIALAICAEIRRQFSLPLDHTRKLYRWLTDKRPDSLEQIVADIAEQNIAEMERHPKIASLLNLSRDDLGKALEEGAARYILREHARERINLMATRPVLQALQLAEIGYLVYLYTDFETQGILTEHNLVDWFAKRMVKKPVILCTLNDIFNAVLEKAGKPKLELDKIASSFLTTLQELQDRPNLTAAERRVVALIRERDYQRITAHVKGGDVIRVEQEEELSRGDPSDPEKRILAAINAGDHMSITVERRDGKIVQIRRKTSIKFDKVTGEP